MSAIVVCGTGVVSPAGWGVAAFREALAKGEALPVTALKHPLGVREFPHRAVPAPNPRPAFLANPRLRRASAISHYAMAAALEALGADAAEVAAGKLRLGVVFAVMSGSVNYSARFYDEVLRDPATASPLVFPETVFNAPASHVSAVLGTGAMNYTIVGDPGAFVVGLAIAADWLERELVDACLVIGAEEAHWLLSEAQALFEPGVVTSSGAGALLLKRGGNSGALAALNAITDPVNFSNRAAHRAALPTVRSQLPSAGASELLCDSTVAHERADADERAAWRDWSGPRLAVKQFLGESFAAGSAWQCVAAVDAIARGEADAARVNVAGLNEQAIAARFVRSQNAG